MLLVIFARVSAIAELLSIEKPSAPLGVLIFPASVKKSSSFSVEVAGSKANKEY